MTIIKVSKGISDYFGDELIYGHVQRNFVHKLIAYVINSKYRKAIALSNWTRNQVEVIPDEVKQVADQIKTYKDFDKQIIEILKFVRKKLQYTTDTNQWSIKERWQTALETVKSWKGDCEDGCILMYVLARIKGIPENRLLNWCGDVIGGGHAALLYKPNLYPLNYCVIDWCYWYDNKSIPNRNKFTLVDKLVKEYKETPISVKEIMSNYKSTWFVFNENFSSDSLKQKTL